MLQKQYDFKRTYNVLRYVPRITCYISNICHAIEGLESTLHVCFRLGCKAESEPSCKFSQDIIIIGTMKSSKYHILAFLATNRLTSSVTFPAEIEEITAPALRAMSN